jgi:hypothetical protein
MRNLFARIYPPFPGSIEIEDQDRPTNAETIEVLNMQMIQCGSIVNLIQI